jgi:DHA1 family bicyclomycin/chloramphenicol resistance-like MFS transporter
MLVALLAMLAPFTLDTYLPSFPDIAHDLGATAQQMQRTLSDYLWAFGAMMLVYGPLSDALGRRRVVLWSLLGYALASAACALVQDIDTLILMRTAQGMAAGAGMVIGRAVVRDLFQGPQAQQVMAKVMLVFAIAPAIAPIIGGWLDALAGWRAVFWFLSGVGLVLTALVAWWLPETLSEDKRQSLHPMSIARGYVETLSNPSFLLLSLIFGLNFGGLFLYIAAAPTLMYDLLGYGVTDFWRLFLPAVGGIVLGSQLSGFVAHRWSQVGTVWVGYGLMGLAATLNLGQALWFEHNAFLVLMPVSLYAAGMALAMSPISLMAMDLFPHRRGMASALQGFAQTTSNGLLAAFVVSAIATSVLGLAWGMAVIMGASLILWLLWRRLSLNPLAA